MKERDIISLVKNGQLGNEQEYEAALSADRTLRHLAKTDPSKAELRKQLRGLIAEYEKIHWSDVEKVTEDKIVKSDELEKFAEKERRFIDQRKKLICLRLDKLKLNQSDLGKLLGHHKSYISELVNGLRPFSQKDLILVHLLLKIPLDELIFVSVPVETRRRIQGQVVALEKKIKLKNDLELVAA